MCLFSRAASRETSFPYLLRLAPIHHLGRGGLASSSQLQHLNLPQHSRHAMDEQSFTADMCPASI